MFGKIDWLNEDTQLFTIISIQVPAELYVGVRYLTKIHNQLFFIGFVFNIMPTPPLFIIIPTQH